jgi:transposase
MEKGKEAKAKKKVGKVTNFGYTTCNACGGRAYRQELSGTDFVCSGCGMIVVPKSTTRWR